MPAQDNEMIAVIFPGKVIIVAGGKLIIYTPRYLGMRSNDLKSELHWTKIELNLFVLSTMIIISTIS
jgi:hypothetical protein